MFQGFYDIHIQLSGVPLLGWDPPPLSSTIYGNNIMHQPVKVFSPIEKVGVIVDALMKKSYNGFPVVEDYEYRCPRVCTLSIHCTVNNEVSVLFLCCIYPNQSFLVLRLYLIMIIKLVVNNKSSFI